MSFQADLFESEELQESNRERKSEPNARHLQRKFIPIVRDQVKFKVESLDDSLPLNHEARVIWKFVEKLDLKHAEESISSLESHVGRPAVHPRILIALWIYGISCGIVSARKIAKNCLDHRGFAWICGGASVGHHILSGFRSKHCELFEELVIQSISLLVLHELVDLKEIAQDGVKIRANVSKQSLHRKKTIKEMHKEVVNHIKLLDEQQKNGSLDVAERKRKNRELTEALQKEAVITKALEELELNKQQKNENPLNNRKKNFLIKKYLN